MYNIITYTIGDYDLFLKLKTRLATQYFDNIWEQKAGMTGWPKYQAEEFSRDVIPVGVYVVSVHFQSCC